MPATNHKIFVKGACIPSEMLLAYHEGKLSPEELRMVEEHVLDCRMCHDELEGIAGFETNAAFREAVTDLKQKITEQYKPASDKPRYIVWITGMAAALFLAVASGYIITKVMNHYGRPELAQQLDTVQYSKEPEQNPFEKDMKSEKSEYTVPAGEISTESENKHESIPTKQKGGSTARTMVNEVEEIPDEEVSNNTTDVIAEVEVKKEVENEAYEQMVVDIMSVEEEPEDNSLTDQGLIMQRSEKQAKKGVQPTLAFQMDAVASTDAKENTGLTKAAFLSFEQGDYNIASAMFFSLIQAGEQSDSVYYCYAVSNVKTDQPLIAIEYFRKLNNPGIFSHDYAWYFANALLMADSVSQALPLLKNLSETDNPYRLSAAKKLTEISSHD